jgi:hypothetical protein
MELTEDLAEVEYHQVPFVGDGLQAERGGFDLRQQSGEPGEASPLR